MKLLAFETATEACSVAVYVDGEVLERFELAPRRHAELALPWADGLLAEAGVAKSQLDAIAVGRGPGAFTGVRLAVALAQGIALALDRPVLPVSTLAALAASATGDRILAAIDARMGEVYLGVFERRDGEVLSVAEELVVRPDLADLPAGESWQGVGTGRRRWGALPSGGRALAGWTHPHCRAPAMSTGWVRWRSHAARASRRNGWSRPTCETTSP